jgi:hypothetical protein
MNLLVGPLAIAFSASQSCSAVAVLFPHFQSKAFQPVAEVSQTAMQVQFVVATILVSWFVFVASSLAAAAGEVASPA